MELVENTVYQVNHTRKGRFTMKFISESGDWVKGEIVSGRTMTMLPENSRTEGEEITIRKSFCTFTEVE